MLLGFSREAAARFSFLLSVPVILGAGVYKLLKALPVLRGQAGWTGATITTGMLLGFTRETAARFSFLLSAPIILGAGAYKLKKALPMLRGEPDWRNATLVGTVVAGIAGYLVIGWLLRYLRTRTTYVFVAWRLALGLLVAVLLHQGVLPRGDEPPPSPPALHGR
jgi:undecaprenyl-diphosphatase